MTISGRMKLLRQLLRVVCMPERTALARRPWPAGGIDLLLKTGMAPEAEAARAWTRWKQTQEFDHFSLLETRLFAAFSARIGELDPASPLLPRIDGLSKKRWTADQMMLVPAADAFDRMAGAGVPFILLRGASVPSKASPRHAAAVR